jgi:protein TonB
MARVRESIYTPYGAFELKATYQRNLLIALAIVTGMVLGGVLTAWALSGDPPDMVVIPPDAYYDTIPITWDDPRGYELEGEPPPIAPPAEVDVPDDFNAVPDSLIPVEMEVHFPSDEDREQAIDGGWGDSAVEGAPFERGIGEGGYGGTGRGERPIRGAFVVVEEEPELIHSVQPEYPRFAKLAGDEGKVIIQALVSENGDVLDAVVFVSSGHALLDEAALAVAGKYKYRPAIQNGHPIALWVTYKVEFKLD